MSVALLVTVGSDYHPFDRLVGGVDAWLDQAAQIGSVVVQYGTARKPRHGECLDYLPHDRLLEQLRSVDVVVTQGGPMGIVEARRCGRIPIVMPRLHRLGEVVDDPQVAFCRQLASTGDIVLVETVEELRRALDRAADDPSQLALTATAAEVDTKEAVDAFAQAVDGLPPRRPGLARWRRH